MVGSSSWFCCGEGYQERGSEFDSGGESVACDSREAMDGDSQWKMLTHREQFYSSFEADVWTFKPR